MEQSELLKHLVNAFEKLGIRYFVTGSIASIFYGEPRFTNDIDIVADINENHIPELLKLFPQKEFYISEEAILDAISHKYQFNIIHPSSGLKIDVIICKNDAFDNSRFKRIKRISPTEDTRTNFSSPEDVIIMKMRHYKEGESEKHLRDIASMLKISGDMIDKKYIENWVDKLELKDIWNAILERLEK
ncbi:MAG: nucleotidyl transferase AbiEii/AbiGii toxin family protein [Deltaproteobacteria bacterium]|nr:MAG: nucleotidyl transferase AbiEii/AbiGii toxin family protein [Deltaproteobacteria bacterium]